MLKYVNRYLRAKRIGIKFFRIKNFLLPKQIKIKNEIKVLSIPNNSTYTELFRDIILDDEYYLLKIKNKKIKTIIDIGANIGLFSVYSKILFPESQIHTYEPNTNNLGHLEANAKEFGFTIYNEAVSSKSGKARLNFSSKHDTAATINMCNNGLINVTSLEDALNRFNENKIDLLKLDCEGSEYEILKSNTSLDKIRYLSLEYHLPVKGSQNRLIELYNILSEQNFSILHESRRNICLGNILAKNDQ